jgi:pyridinium-3,5-bisthiocarboxylic acid mononucleotide nickel chelatase
MSPSDKHAWIDASAGIAGDMLLGALVDAGADLEVVQRSIDAVIPGSVRLETETVTRAGLRAIKINVRVLVGDPPHRTWRSIRDLLASAELPAPVRDSASAVFARLAEVEANVHDVPAETVHFHEVGALDSIADVVGVCAALHAIGDVSVSAGVVSLGSGVTSSSHGEVAVPVPAVTQLARGWRVQAGGPGELTTPTGMALLATLADEQTELPAMDLGAVGVGAGTADRPGRANVTRVLLGSMSAPHNDSADDAAVVLEANIDDLDPRMWPGILTRLLSAGALDAWLVPILMKKGRPAHTLCALARPDAVAPIRDIILSVTSTLGVRHHGVSRLALPRAWIDVEIGSGAIPVKIGYRDGVILQVTPEFDAIATYAARHGEPEHSILQRALAAAADLGIKQGAAIPSSMRSS